MLSTPISEFLNKELVKAGHQFMRKAGLVLLAAVLILAIGPAHAGEPEEDEQGAGFFHYFPAPPKIKLPTINIPFWTDDLKKARRAYNDDKFGKALKYFRRSSEDGNAVADWYLASMYRMGQGTPVDHSVAYSYYQRVAESSDPDESDPKRLRIFVDSQLHLADYKRVGIPAAGIKADPVGAARNYLHIANTYGHPGAQYALGMMNMKGDGMKKNPVLGLKWLTAAARKRHPEAQAYLGDLYWSGTGVKKSETRAVMWYTLAQETAKPLEHGKILSRYSELLLLVDGETRLEAEARARVWSDQYPPE